MGVMFCLSIVQLFTRITPLAYGPSLKLVGGALSNLSLATCRHPRSSARAAWSASTLTLP